MSRPFVLLRALVRDARRVAACTCGAVMTTNVDCRGSGGHFAHRSAGCCMSRTLAFDGETTAFVGHPVAAITGSRNRILRMHEPTVFVIDNDLKARRAVSDSLRFKFRVQTYDSPASFFEAVPAGAPGCIVLELALPGISGLELQARLAEGGWLQPIVFLTGSGSVRASVQAIRAGAMDVIEKPWQDETLIDAIRRALEADREAQMRRDTTESLARRLALLTPRESQVFRHIIAGRLNKQIAARLGTAEKTIKVHRGRVMRKMSVRSVAELTRFAGFIGIQPEP